MIIGVLGPEGSYSEKAARLWVRKKGLKNAELHYYEDIEDAFFAAAGRKCSFSVLPVENSIEGSIGVTLDLLLEKDVMISGEVVVKIEHCLLSKGKPEKIKVVLSHPQGLAQCRRFIKNHFPNAEVRSTGSTSHAARLAGEFEEMAAIASREAAERYGLKVLVSNIQDRKENYTRFLVIRAKRPEETGLSGFFERKLACNTCVRWKTSLIVYLEKDRPGALYELLGVFASRKINLTRIESRPSKRELGDYYFYIDFEGCASDALIKDAFADIAAKADMLKFLGSYPAFENS